MPGLCAGTARGNKSLTGHLQQWGKKSKTTEASRPHVFVSQRFEQEQQHGLKVLFPHHQAVLPGHLQHLQQGPPALLRAPLPCLALGELLQQLSDQLQLLSSPGCRWRGKFLKKSENKDQINNLFTSEVFW